MATSKCPKCESTRFEMKEHSKVSGSEFKINFIQCASCGSVVGVTDFYNIPSLLEKLAEKLGFNLHG